MEQEGKEMCRWKATTEKIPVAPGLVKKAKLHFQQQIKQTQEWHQILDDLIIIYSLIWVLDGCCWSNFHKWHITLHITIFNNSFPVEGDYEHQILLSQKLFAFRHKNNSQP